MVVPHRCPPVVQLPSWLIPQRWPLAMENQESTHSKSDCDLCMQLLWSCRNDLPRILCFAKVLPLLQDSLCDRHICTGADLQRWCDDRQ